MPTEVKWVISFLAGALLLWIGWKVFVVLVLLHVLICLVLIGVILMQSGEAADLAGAFGGSGSQTAFGPRGAATFLSKATTWCAVMFMFTSAALAVHVRTTTVTSGRSVLEQFSKPAPAPKTPAQQPLQTLPQPSSPIQAPGPGPAPTPQTPAK